MENKKLSLTETAKLIRESLKRTFPKTKFSVRSKSYSMGCSIDIYWKNGEAYKKVHDFTRQFEGASFDGMNDIKEYKNNGMGTDYVFCNREISEDMKEKIAKEKADKFGFNFTGLYDTVKGIKNDYITFAQWIYPELNTSDFY